MADVLNKLQTGENPGELGGVLNDKQVEEGILERLLPQLKAYQDAQKTVLKDNDGTKVKWLGFRSLADVDGDVEEGVTPDAEALDPYEIEAEVKQRIRGIKLTDRTLKHGKVKCQAVAMKLLSEAGAKAIDRIIYERIMAETYKVYGANGKGVTLTANAQGEVNTQLETTIGAEDYLVQSDITKATVYLKDKNVPTFEDDCYHCLVTPKAASDIRNFTKFIDKSKYQDPTGAGLLKGEIGKLEGVKFIETTNIPKTNIYLAKSVASGASIAGLYARTGSAAPYTYTVQTGTASSAGTYYEKLECENIFLYGADAYGVVDVEGGQGKPKHISKALGSAGTDDWGNQRASEAIKFEFTAKVLQDADANINDAKDSRIVRIIAPAQIEL